MNLELIPRLAMTHIGATLGGFVLALWCAGTAEPGNQNAKEGPGFVITLKSPRTTTADISELGKLQPLWIHHRFNSSTNGPCIRKLEVLKTRYGMKSIQILGDTGDLPRIVPYLSDLKSGQSWVSNPLTPKDLPDCGDVPTVEYGSLP